MTASLSAVEQLSRLPSSERRPALEATVTEQFKAVLMMPEEEPLPLHASLFALGMSSVLISEVQQRLSTVVGCDLSTSVLFNTCTVGQVVEYLVTEVLIDLFQEPAPPVRQVVEARSTVLWDDVLRELNAETV